MSEFDLLTDTFFDVTAVELAGGYKVCVWFDDDSQQIIDFEPVLHGPLFGQLRDMKLFNQVRVDADLGTLVWPNGADIDPNVLHDWPEHVDAIVARRLEQFAVIA